MDQAAVAALVLVALVSLAAIGWCKAARRGRLIEIDRAAPQPVTFQLDVNAGRLAGVVRAARHWRDAGQADRRVCARPTARLPISTTCSVCAASAQNPGADPPASAPSGRPAGSGGGAVANRARRAYSSEWVLRLAGGSLSPTGEPHVPFELVSPFPAGRRSAAGHCHAGRGTARRPQRAGADGRHRLGQDVHDGQRHPGRCSGRRWSCRTTRRWPPSSTASSRSSSRTTPSTTSSATTTTTSPRRTSRSATSTSRRTPRSTRRSTACGWPRPARWSAAAT